MNQGGLDSVTVLQKLRENSGQWSEPSIAPLILHFSNAICPKASCRTSPTALFIYLFTLLMTVFTKACDAYQKFTTYIITEPTGI